jgi:oxygen-independent coproporphyrinogen III oxidase
LAGIYVHIPFCKQACHYCNFHFVTSLRYKNEMLSALLTELELRKDYAEGETIETIYYGGGTPSLLSVPELMSLTERVHALYPVISDAEITIETNPDDISDDQLTGWKSTGINRLSIGVQSFFDEDLRWMNRAHNAQQAIAHLELAKYHYDNISADLIYGTPTLTDERWKENVERMIAMNIPHLSCYALTVEPRTPLHKMIREHLSEDVDPSKQSGQFLLLMEWLVKAGYEHYEISNFAMQGYRSKHNSSYWSGKKYIGIGPSAHSYDGENRQWNVSNNQVYIERIALGEIPAEKETLTGKQKLNEYIMTSLRTIEGLNLDKVHEMRDTGLDDADNKIKEAATTYIKRGWMVEQKHSLVLTREGKLMADGIAADLFF